VGAGKLRLAEAKLIAMAQHVLPPQNITLLDHLLQHLFGSACRIADYEVIRWSTDYAVVIADLLHAATKVVVKLAGPAAPVDCPFEQTAAINHIIRRQTVVPTFHVLAADASYRAWPWRYLVTTYMPGHTWLAVHAHLNQGELRDAYRQMGNAIAQLHTIRFPAFGEVDADGTVRAGNPYLQALTERARRRIKQPQHADLFTALLRDRAHLFADVEQPGLCHEDLNPNNLLFDQDKGCWKLSAVLDFESAWAGNAESDLARLELWHAMIGDGWWEAYGACRSVQATYTQRRLIYQLLWCLEYAAATSRHIQDTRRICAELGIDPITFR
jgi:aminoglycoside phosphotransferase (APT) family kinase protein